MNVNTPPPGKLSDLLDLAIADARKLDRNHYKPLWSTWHAPGDKAGQCMMCLGGSIIAGTLGCPIDTNVELTTKKRRSPLTTSIDDELWRKALWALDFARGGDWLGAFFALHGNYPKSGVYEERVDRLRKIGL